MKSPFVVLISNMFIALVVAFVWRGGFHSTAVGMAIYLMLNGFDRMFFVLYDIKNKVTLTSVDSSRIL